jgi:hypothetical protein
VAWPSGSGSTQRPAVDFATAPEVDDPTLIKVSAHRLVRQELLDPLQEAVTSGHAAVSTSLRLVPPAYPVIVNDPRATALTVGIAAELMGSSRARSLLDPLFIAEDFAVTARDAGHHGAGSRC